MLSSMKWELGPICQRYPPKLIQAPPYPSPSPLPPLHIHLKSPLQSPYTSLQPSRAADSESWWPEGSSSIPSGHRCQMVKPKTKDLRPKTKDQKQIFLKHHDQIPNTKKTRWEPNKNTVRWSKCDQPNAADISQSMAHVWSLETSWVGWLLVGGGNQNMLLAIFLSDELNQRHNNSSYASLNVEKKNVHIHLLQNVNKIYIFPKIIWWTKSMKTELRLHFSFKILKSLSISSKKCALTITTIFIKKLNFP